MNNTYTDAGEKNEQFEDSYDNVYEASPGIKTLRYHPKFSNDLSPTVRTRAGDFCF